MKTGIELIREERERQVLEEGWTPEHDDKHDLGQMAAAASCYALAGAGFLAILEMKGWREGWPVGRKFRFWPWSLQWWKPKDRVRNLVKAGALIAAEIDRLQRLENDCRQKSRGEGND